jgi:hypothetical protein
MRNNYVGDVGDYYKYALLRHLTGHKAEDDWRALVLGVVWYLYPDPCKANDGNHRSYLEEANRARFEPLDPELYASMAAFCDPALRTVEEVARRGILPPGTSFFAEELSFSGFARGTPSAIQEIIAHRNAWIARAMEATRGADLIFADPDNGLEVASVAIHRNRGAKFAFFSELAPFWERGQSLILYQHRDRSAADEQAEKRKAELREKLPGAAFVEVIYFPAFGGGRMFFIAAQPAHAKILRSRLDSFKAKAEEHLCP